MIVNYSPFILQIECVIFEQHETIDTIVSQSVDNKFGTQITYFKIDLNTVQIPKIITLTDAQK